LWFSPPPPPPPPLTRQPRQFFRDPHSSIVHHHLSSTLTCPLAHLRIEQQNLVASAHAHVHAHSRLHAYYLPTSTRTDSLTRTRHSLTRSPTLTHRSYTSYDWIMWFFRERREPPLGLICLGSTPGLPTTDTPNMQAARYESGLDNSPM
jgi:hypothetical protein